MDKPTKIETDLAKAIVKLGVHEHVCLIYETREEQFAAVLPFIKIGLERGEKCVYIVDDNTAEVVINGIKAEGIDAEAAIQSGKLTIASKQDAYLKQGHFDPDRMIDFLRRATAEAKAAGFTALRVTGETTWVLVGDPGVERIMEYEAKLNYFFHETDILAICQYNRNRFSPEVIKNVISTHPLIIYGGMVCRNYYYVPPDKFLGVEQSAREVDRLLAEIKSRTKIEEALREREDRFRTMFEKSGDGIILADKQTRTFRYVNQTICSMLGYSKNELMQMGVQDIHPEHDLPHVLKQFDKQGMGLIDLVPNIPCKRKDSSILFVDIKTSAIIVGGKECVMGVFRDVTERKQADEKLKEVNETLEQRVAEKTKIFFEIKDEMIRLTQAVEQSPTCVIITDTKGNIEYVNPRFVELTGYTIDEVIGKTPRILKSNKTSPERYKDLWDTITSGKTWQGELINQKKNGTFYWALASISPLKNLEGKATRYLAFKSDITEIRMLEEEQQKLKEHLYHAQKLESVGRLAGGIAHDFNNKLMTIMGYSELAEAEIAEGNPAKEYVKKILESSTKATELTQNLLAFSRRQPVSLLPVSLNSVIGSIERLLLKTVGENIDCKLTLMDKDIQVFADSDKIEHALMNLANNAVDAMPDGGCLTICTDVVVLDSKSANKYGLDKDGTYGVITVSDTGMGMDEEIKGKLFEPFFTTKERGKGTGLGLAIVYGIVKQHYGHIEVISEPGKGAVFKIYLPPPPPPPPRTTTMNEFVKTASEVTLFTKVKTILVAEDDDDVRALIIRILESSGYHVISAINGDDAIKRFEEHKDKIDMLLFDVMMPKKDGKDAYNSIKKLMSDIKVLFMSGYSENIITNKEIREEGLTFIEKPMSSNGLLKKIEELWQTT